MAATRVQLADSSASVVVLEVPIVEVLDSWPASAVSWRLRVETLSSNSCSSRVAKKDSLLGTPPDLHLAGEEDVESTISQGSSKRGVVLRGDSPEVMVSLICWARSRVAPSPRIVSRTFMVAPPYKPTSVPSSNRTRADLTSP